MANCSMDNCEDEVATSFDLGMEIKLDDHTTHGYGLHGEFCKFHAKPLLSKYYEQVQDAIDDID